MKSRSIAALRRDIRTACAASAPPEVAACCNDRWHFQEGMSLVNDEEETLIEIQEIARDRLRRMSGSG